MGQRAFEDCYGFNGTLTLSENLTTIEYYCFYNCHGFTGNLIIPNNVTSIGGSAFYHCYGFNGTLTLSNNLTSIDGYAFRECRNFTGNLTIPDGVTELKGCTFNGCQNFNGKLKLPSYLTKIGWEEFSGCKNLTGNLTIPNSVTTIAGYAFFLCENLDGTLTLPNSLTTIGQSAFEFCGKLKGDLSIPANTTDVGLRAFYNCSSLDGTLTIPASVTTIGDGAFFNCQKLKGDISAPGSITNLGNGAFFNCQKLTGDITVPVGRENITYTYTGTAIKSLSVLPGANTKIFSGSNAILPNIFVPSAGAAFAGCKNLKYLDLRHINSEINANFSDADTLSLSRGPRIATSFAPFENMPLNTLIYLPKKLTFKYMIGHDDVTRERTTKEWLSFADATNFVVNDSCTNFVLNDASEYKVPVAFRAQKTSYDRTFTNVSGKSVSTLFLPYPATLPDGMRAYTLTRKNTVFRESFIFQAVPGNQLEANKPYLVKITDGSASKQFGTDLNMQVPATPARAMSEIQAGDGSNFFFGGAVEHLDNTTLTASATERYYNLNNGTWLPIRNTDPNGHVHSFRCYIRTTGAAPAKSFAMVFEDEQTTGIGDAAEFTEDELKSGRYTFYTLDGRSAGNNYDALKSGEIYVVKGRKFYKF